MIFEFFYVLRDIFITCLEIFFVLFLMHNEERKEGVWRIIIFSAVMVGTIVIMSMLNFPLAIKYSVIILLIISLGKVVYKCNFVRRLLYGLINIIVIDISEIIVIQIWNVFNEPIVTDNALYQQLSFLVLLLAKAFQFLLVIIFERIMRKDREESKIKDLIPIILSSLPYFLVLESINLTLPHVDDERYIAIFVCSAIAVLCAFIFNVIFNNHHLEIKKRAREEKTAHYTVQLKYDYYKKKLEDEEMVKEIYHDLKNHFLLADSVINEEIKEKLQRFENYYDTGNEFLNIIISDKNEKARLKKIRLECDISFNGYDFMEPLDISTIFGNILDNAIEACEKVEEESRYIFLNVVQRGELLIVVIKNKMQNIKFDFKEPIITSKKNKTIHGFGLSNMVKAVKKYNGECKISTKDSEFIISIIFPIPKKKFNLEVPKI